MKTGTDDPGASLHERENRCIISSLAHFKAGKLRRRTDEGKRSRTCERMPAGKEKHYPDIDNIFEICYPVPICPEQLGGLATPRPPAEQTGDRVMTENGADVTEAYEKGAKEAVKAADLYGCRFALLKEKSPSCGSGKIYDGTFTRTLREGDGTAARLLKEKGIRVYGESQTEALIKEITAVQG